MSIKVTWYSHACFLIETDGGKLLIDPFITDNPLFHMVTETTWGIP
jgi:L-ascorbate metabolism protein UlaG (beta-lactamase superfamily)